MRTKTSLGSFIEAHGAGCEKIKRLFSAADDRWESMSKYSRNGLVDEGLPPILLERLPLEGWYLAHV